MAERDELPPIPRCPACGFEGEGARQPRGAVACPSCGELWAADAEDTAGDVSLPERRSFEVLGQELLGQLAAGHRDEAPLGDSKLKTTDERDAGGTERSRKKKRPPNPQRRERQVGWDELEVAPKRVRRSRWRKWKSAALRASGGAVLLALAVLLAYAVAIAIKRHSPDVATPAGPPDGQGVAPVALETLSTGERRAVIGRIETAYRGFLAAGTLEERIAFVRDPERVRPLMEEYHRQHPVAPLAVRDLPDGQQYRSRATLAMTTLLMEDYSTRPIAVQRVADGEFRVDWESFVGHCEVPWREMSTQRPSAPFLVRALVSPSNERDGRWPAGGWQAWQLEDREGKHRLHGFSRLGSRPHIEIAVAVNESRKPSRDRRGVPLTLRIAFAPEAPAGDTRVEIVDYLALGWVYPTDPG